MSQQKLIDAMLGVIRLRLDVEHYDGTPEKWLKIRRLLEFELKEFAERVVEQYLDEGRGS